MSPLLTEEHSPSTPTPRPSVAVWLASIFVLALCLWFATVGIVLLHHGAELDTASLFDLPLLHFTKPILHGCLAVVAALLIGACQYVAIRRRSPGFSLIVAIVFLGLGIIGYFVPSSIPLLEFASEGVRDLVLGGCLFAGVVMLRWSARLPLVASPRNV